MGEGLKLSPIVINLSRNPLSGVLCDTACVNLILGNLEGDAIVGIVDSLGFVEATEDEELRRARQEKSNFKYAKSFLALALPVAYCILDALGTFADSLVLEKLDEGSANVAYELTFLFVGVVCAIYVLLIKRQPLVPKMEAPKYAGAIFETAGQFAYIYAIADSEHVMFSAPIIT
jgi:hypothetical protein